MPPIYKAWVSTCGQYLALEAPASPSACAYDVLEADGPKVWLARRYACQGWADTDVRYTHAEFPGIITSWSTLGRWTRNYRRYIGGFRMTFVDIRQDIQVLPFTTRPTDISAIVARYEATFLRQRRVSAARWQALQARIATAIAAGTASLYAATGTCPPTGGMSRQEGAHYGFI